MSMTDRPLSAPERFRGEWVVPGDDVYDAAGHIYNHRMRGRPAVIARCIGVADVRAALAFARERGLELSVRGGGHSVGGWSSNDGGLVIDLTLMRSVRVDPEARTAWVGGGARAGDILVEAEPHGLVVAAGAGQGIGVAGLTMGLGEGYLTPKHGYGCDSLLAFELVTADGALLRVSADEHPELFWAMRGSGANFGVVTAYEVRLHPLPEQAVGGVIVFDGKELEPLTRHVWEAMEHGSECFWPQVIYTATAPGALQVRVLPGHTGPPAQAQEELGALCRAGTLIADDSHPTSYVGLVWELPDAPGRRAWEVARFPFGEDPERQMAVLLEQVRSSDPGLALAPGRLILLWRTTEQPPASPPSAAPRLPGITMCIMAAWEDPARDADEVAWIERTAAAFRESGVVREAGNTINHVGTVDQDRARRLYGDDAYERLARLKAQFDPQNVFHRNYNIPPAPALAGSGA